MKKQIFYLCSCDAWKSRSSMRLMFIGTSPKKLKSFIAKKIEDGEFLYGPNTYETPSQKQKELFLKEFEKEDRPTINSRLEYGYFDYTYNNEEI